MVSFLPDTWVFQHSHLYRLWTLTLSEHLLLKILRIFLLLTLWNLCFFGHQCLQLYGTHCSYCRCAKPSQELVLCQPPYFTNASIHQLYSKVHWCLCMILAQGQKMFSNITIYIILTQSPVTVGCDLPIVLNLKQENINNIVPLEWSIHISEYELPLAKNWQTN